MLLSLPPEQDGLDWLSDYLIEAIEIDAAELRGREWIHLVDAMQRVGCHERAQSLVAERLAMSGVDEAEIRAELSGGTQCFACSRKRLSSRSSSSSTRCSTSKLRRCALPPPSSCRMCAAARARPEHVRQQ